LCGPARTKSERHIENTPPESDFNLFIENPTFREHFQSRKAISIFSSKTPPAGSTFNPEK